MQAPSHLQERHHLIGAPGHSLALHYEVLLKESRPDNEQGSPHRHHSSKTTPTGPSQERIDTCFQVFDDLLVHLGVYQRVMKLVRDELYAAAYSGEYTSGRGSSTHPLPWCVIASRLMGKKAGEHSRLKAEIDSLKEQLYTCEADLEKASSALESHRHEVKERDGKLHRLSSELRARAGECERLQKIIGQQQHAQERMRQEAELRMYSLRNTIGNLKEDNTRLREYKTSYDKVQEALSVAQPTSQSQPANYKAELGQHVRTTEKLKQQLLRMRNSLLNEYDGWLSSCVSGEEQGQLLLPAAISRYKRDFKKNMADVSSELSLLDGHAHSLSDRIGQLDDHRTAPSHVALVLPDHPANPLLPQLQTASKFAVMLHSSSDNGNGNTFYSVKEGQQCSNCGHKTVVCPHKVLPTGEVIIPLPLGSTHIKLCQPVLQVVDQSEATPTSAKSRQVATPRATQHYLPPDFNKIWKEFGRMFGDYQNLEPHTLTDEDTITFANHFCAGVVQRDDAALLGEEDTPATFMEWLVSFIEQRYRVACVVPLITHSFITALTEHHTQHKELLVLSHTLSGELDGCGLRQLLLLAGLVDMMPWSSLSEFTPFASLLYPSLQEEEVDHITMNFVSFSGNKISAQLVLDFLTWQLMRHKDPLVLHFERQLSEQPCRASGSMLEVEFAEAADNLMSLVSDQLCRHLYLQSMAQLHEEENSHKTRKTLPIKRLSYIAYYLHSLSQLAATKSRVELLAQQTAAALPSKPHPPTQPTPAQHKPRLFTIETARDMANRMKALAQCK